MYMYTCSSKANMCNTQRFTEFTLKWEIAQQSLVHILVVTDPKQNIPYLAVAIDSGLINTQHRQHAQALSCIKAYKSKKVHIHS